MAAINALNWKQMNWGSELTDQNSMAQALLTRPEISDTLAYAFGDKFHLQYLTQGSGRVSENYKLIGNKEVMWSLMGMLEKAIPITSAVAPSSNIGLNFSPFRVPMGEKYFGVGDVLRSDSGTLARVQSVDNPDGTDWVYTMQLDTADPNAVLSTADAAIGKEWSFDFSAFEEYSDGGTDKEAHPMWFKNQMTTSRAKWSMSGGSRTDVMTLQVEKEGGGKSFLWLYGKQYQKMLQWMGQTERMRWYGIYNRTSTGEVHLPGENGRPVFTGSGVIEQIASANRRSYSSGSESLYRNFISDLVMNSSEAENKKFIGFTGRGGMDEFHTAMKTAIAASNIIDTHFVTKNGQNLTFGSDFITYKGLLNTEITMVYNPIFDNPTSHRKIHPISGWPQESYRVVMLDFSDYAGEPNISLCAKGADGVNRSMINWYTAGSTTPDGGDSGIARVMRSNGLDGFTSYMLSETLIKIINPLSCGMLEYVEN